MALANEEKKLKHLFDGSELNVYDSKILNLGVGAPGTDLLENCCKIFQEATAHRLDFEKDSNSSMLFQYGATSGSYEVRNEIAKYFTKIYASEVRSEDLVLTTGATQGLHIILSTLVDFNGYIFVDEFTYMLALECIKQFTTFNIVPVRLNDDGVDLEDFEKKLQEKRYTSKSKEFWAMYYTIPNYHNPTGILFSAEVCHGIVELARKYDFLVTCDDVYNILCYDDQQPSRLFSYDVRTDHNYSGNVISNSSFSKIISPGLRLGWLELPARAKVILDRSGVINSGGCLNNYTSGIVGSLFELNLAQPHISKLHDAYKGRMIVTCAIFAKNLPEGCRMLTPTGGYFIWIRLPQEIDAKEFLNYCLREASIYFIPGSRFALEEGIAKNYLRISIAFHSKEKLMKGAELFCATLNNYLSKS